jgi:ABC-type bacteriocin/lantibiotic exporter with double-glycine peptidase domain
MKILYLPKLRQFYNYDCGANSVQSVLAYYGINIREEFILKSAKTSKEGTPIKGIIKTIKKYGLKTTAKEMTIKNLKYYIRKKIPVILVLQAWTNKKKINWEKDWIDGHYVVAIGFTKDKILFEDPSSFNRTFLKYDELNKRWHDIDTNGKKYLHYGIAIYGKTPKFKSKKIIHME